MKKKFLSVISVVLLTSMMTASLTGCGSRAKATDVDYENEETIVVNNDSSSENYVTEDEVIINEETDVNTDDFENDTFVFYPEFENFPDEPDVSFEFEDYEEEVTVEDDTPILVEGKELGYIKAGSTIKLIEKNQYDNVYRVENNTGIGFEYIYVLSDDLLTISDMKDYVVSKLDYLSPTILDAPDNDMEYIEFSFDKVFNSGVQDIIHESLHNDSFDIVNYTTFYVECTKSETISEEYTERMPRYLVDCKVYYK